MNANSWYQVRPEYPATCDRHTLWYFNFLIQLLGLPVSSTSFGGSDLCERLEGRRVSSRFDHLLRQNRRDGEAALSDGTCCLPPGTNVLWVAISLHHWPTNSDTMNVYFNVIIMQKVGAETKRSEAAFSLSHEPDKKMEQGGMWVTKRIENNEEKTQRLDLTFDVNFSERFGSNAFEKLTSLSAQKHNVI